MTSNQETKLFEEKRDPELGTYMGTNCSHVSSQYDKKEIKAHD